MEINLSPVVSDFYLDNTFNTLIIGPIGSGKTLGCILKLDKLMYEQEPNTDGIRYTRWVIIRNTYKELQDTTIKSFESYYGSLLKINKGDMTGLYEHDGVNAEFLFRSLDKPDDMKKLLSLNITGAYLNELRELSHDALQNVISRLGRYPEKKDGPGCTQSNIIADTNAFDNDHWIYDLYLTDKRPSNYKVYIQPPALLDDNSVNPEAENLENLPKDYYTRQVDGATENFIDIMLKVKFIAPKVGLPVYPEFNQKLHTIDHVLVDKPNKDIELICGGDNGRWSAYLMAQVDKLGRLVVFDELISDDMNLTEFGGIIKSHIQKDYSEYRVESWIDPWAANQRGQVTDMTMFKVYKNLGLNPKTSNTRSPETMVEGVKAKFQKIIVGQPAILISNRCKTLIKGLNGGYNYRRKNVSGDKYADKPDKGKYSHVCNAFEFLVDGMGGSREILRSNRGLTKPIQINTNWNPLD